MTRGPIPNVYERVLDYQLGAQPPTNDNVFLKIGVASSGPINELISFNSIDDVVSIFGGGPLVESAAYHLAISGAPLVLVRCVASIPGALGAVTAALKADSTGALAITGEPLDSYGVRVRVDREGAAGAAAFVYSLDGGDLYSGLMAIPLSGVYPIPNTGLTLTFSGAFKAGDAFEAEASAPASSLADVNDSITAAFNDPAQWSIGHILGEGSPLLFAALEVRANEALTNDHRFIRFVMEVRDFKESDNSGVAIGDTSATAKALRRAKWAMLLGQEYANSLGSRVSPVAGFVELTGALNGRVMRRSAAWPYVARLGAIPVHKHPGEVRAGNLPGVISITHDEAAHSGLGLLGFTTLRTLRGKKGFYVTEGLIMAPPGSDYRPIENARVIDKCLTVSRNAALDYLNSDVNIGADGLITEEEAKALEAYVNSQLRDNVTAAGNASDAFIIVKREPDLLANRQIKMRVCILPRGYLSHIFIDVGFFNRALVVQQQ